MMKYSKELPTEPGWYWVRRVTLKEIFEQIVCLRNYAGYLHLDNCRVEEGMYDEWAGPIPHPDEFLENTTDIGKDLK